MTPRGTDLLLGTKTRECCEDHSITEGVVEGLPLAVAPTAQSEWLAAITAACSTRQRQQAQARGATDIGIGVIKASTLVRAAQTTCHITSGFCCSFLFLAAGGKKGRGPNKVFQLFGLPPVLQGKTKGKQN